MAQENDREETPLEGSIIEPEDPQDSAAQEPEQQEPETIRLEPHEYGEPTRTASREKKLFEDDDPRNQGRQSSKKSSQRRRPKREKKLKTEPVQPEPMSDPEPEQTAEQGPEDFIQDKFSEDHPWVREMRRSQAEREAREKGRKTYSFEGSRYLSEGLVDTGNPEADLRTNINNAGSAFMDSVVEETARDAGKVENDLQRQQLYDSMSSKHKMYTMMMGMSCLAGLRNGVTPSALLRSATMAGTMWACSPNFRTVVGGMLGPKLEPLQDKIKGVLDARIEERRQKEQKKVDKAVSKAEAKGEPLSKRWEERLAKSMSKDGRMPFSVQSAAMTEVSLNEGFYRAMREPGADIDSLRDTHRFAMEKLYTEAASDGVNPESISKASRIIIGHQMEDDPAYASVYEELAHSDFEKGPAQSVRIEGTDREAKIWSGEYRNDFGQRITSGSFGVREPMEGHEHQQRIARTIAGDMLSATSVSGFNSSMLGYGLGLKMEIDPEQRSQLNPEVARRMDRADRFYTAMTADGIEVDEMEKVYSNAYLDALEIVRSRNPELEQEWTDRYGEGWQERFRQFMDDPQGFMAREQEAKSAREKWGPRGEPFTPEPEARTSQDSTRPDKERERQEQGHGPQPAQTGPDRHHQSTAAKYRRARTNQGYNKIDTGRFTGWGVDDYDPGEDFELGS